MAKVEDQPKPDYSLLPTMALHQVVLVLTDGQRKHPRRCWTGPVTDAMREKYFAASMRHAWAHFRGELVDPESGQPALAHAIADLMILLEFG